MVNKVYESRSAEKVIFRELFTNASTVAVNGGTLTGSPTINNGVTLDGSTQYVSYSIPATIKIYAS